MSVRTIRNLGGVVLAGGLMFGAATGAFAQNGSSVPDAQVESNVLRALASAPELSTQNIQSSTVYGTVTLTGNVHDETLRTKAENLVARAQGVKKVVDELTLGDTPPPAADDQSEQNEPPPNEQSDSSQANQPVPQSDGTYAPAPDGSRDAAPPPPEGQGQQDQERQYRGQQDQDEQNDAGAPPPPSGRQPMDQDGPPPNEAPIPGGQQAGIAVTVPAGAMLRIRINRGLDSNHIEPGTNFDGIVLTDVVAGGAVAIPRGAVVTGTVIDAKKAGTFKGRGELSLQIDNLSLGGNVYPLTTEVWAENGRDKTAGTVGNTVGLGAFGALLGAVAGGGTGAAIGAGVGAGAGLAASAASSRGQIIIPPESVLNFRIAAPITVRTVSEREMERLSYAAGPMRRQGPPRVRYYSPAYGYYYGPPR